MSGIRQLGATALTLIKAIATGMGVQIIGFVILLVLVRANLAYAPNIPWAVVPLGLALWAFWSYFGGRGWPGTTSAARQWRRRSNPVARQHRTSVIIAGGAFSLCVLCAVILQNSLRALPPEALGLVNELVSLPLWSSIPLATMAAIYVGVTEEVSFRGYMQVPLEARFGPGLGLTVPALAFAASHGVDPAVLPIFFLVSIGWGVLAWRVDSIRPGIICHCLIDWVGFLWAIFRFEDIERIMSYSLIDSGINSGYQQLIWLGLFLILASGAAFFNLHRKGGEQRQVLS